MVTNTTTQTHLTGFAAILFDMDGVVIDSNRVWDRVNEIMMQEFNYTFDRRGHEQNLIGMTQMQSVEYIMQHSNLRGDVGKIAERKGVLGMELYEEMVEYFPQFPSFHREITVKGFRSCICTASQQVQVDGVNKKLDLSAYFGNRIFPIDLVGNVSKPAPDIYLYGAKQLGVDPAQCLVIEDSPNGVRAGKAAGMTVIAVTHTFPAEILIKERADIIVDSFDEILPLL